MQTDNCNYRNREWEEEYLITKTKTQTNKTKITMTTTKNTETATLSGKPLWKCSPEELRGYCAENGIKIQDGLRQYQLANIVKEHLAPPKQSNNVLPNDGGAAQSIAERSERGRKMTMPSGIVTKEEKKKEKAEKKAPANVKELKERADIKAILAADTFKKEKIQELGKLGLDRFAIADLCGTNQGHVWNVLNEQKKEA